MNRVSTWEAALQAVIHDARGRGHVYGEHDCSTFCSAAVMAMTGHDPLAEFRGHYDTREGAIAALATIGAGDLESTMDTKFPVGEIARARRGDIALIDGDMDSIGVVAGRFAWCVSEDGLARVPMTLWRKVWSVG